MSENQVNSTPTEETAKNDALIPPSENSDDAPPIPAHGKKPTAKPSNRVCRYYSKSGKCHFGDGCRFVHVLKTVQQPNNANNASIPKRPPAPVAVKRPVIFRPDRGVLKSNEDGSEKQKKLRQHEIEVIKKRFPQLKAIADDDVVITAEATDPDWPFDLKHLELRLTLPESYPIECFTVSVVGPEMAPKLLCDHVTVACRKWLTEKMEKQVANDAYESLLRAFILWLDRNMLDFFVQGLKKVQLDLQAKAAGISMATLEDFKPGAEQEAADSSEEEILEEKADFTNDSSTEEVKTLSLQEPKFASNGDVRLTSWTFGENVASLMANKLTMMQRCDRCAFQSEISIRSGTQLRSSCPQCHVQQQIEIKSQLVHHFCPTLALINAQGCTPLDVVLLASEFVITCLQCNKEVDAKAISHGAPVRSWCRGCHTKLELQIDTIRIHCVKDRTPDASAAKFKAKPKVQNDVRIKEGEPLPAQGTCKHYRKSYRWFRFPCCGKLYPCDLCHEQDAGHEMKFANRIVCGFCSKEQPYQSTRPCTGCGGNVVRSRSSHWEGGKGNRNKNTMSRNDNHKYVNQNKSVSGHKKKVEEFKLKKAT